LSFHQSYYGGDELYYEAGTAVFNSVCSLISLLLKGQNKQLEENKVPATFSKNSETSWLTSRIHQEDIQATDSVFVTVLKTENNFQKPKHFQTFPVRPNVKKQEEISPCLQMTILCLKWGMKQGEENEIQCIGKH